MATAGHSSLTTEVGSIDELTEGFHLTLRAEGKSPATIALYLVALERLSGHLKAHGMPTHATAIRREHIEHFLVTLTEEGRKPSTVSVYYRSLQPFWKWAVEQGEVDESPMAKMHPPKVPPKPVPVIETSEVDKILATVRGKTFEQRRDHAILRLLADTGCRRGELAGMRVSDVHIDRPDTGPAERELDHYVTVTGKARKTRAIPMRDETAVVLLTYVNRARSHHKLAKSDMLWLGERGALSGNGILQMMRRRARQAGVPAMFVHRWRHQRAHTWLHDGGTESGLMALMGWESPLMLRRYGASAAGERARREFRRLTKRPQA